MVSKRMARPIVCILTDVAVDVQLDVCVIGPYDGIDAFCQSFEEEPEAEKDNAEIPALADEAGQKYEEQHYCSQDAGNRVEGVCWIRGCHGA